MNVYRRFKQKRRMSKMNNNKEKSDAVSELKSIKEVQEDFNKEKTKNNLT